MLHVSIIFAYHLLIAVPRARHRLLWRRERCRMVPDELRHSERPLCPVIISTSSDILSNRHLRDCHLRRVDERPYVTDAVIGHGSDKN
jgi:hypothetical protein